MNYRPEIDGLRTLAVIPVIIFHMGLEWLPGGFLGVDVFFVISGYLITAILLRDLNEGSFSLKEFYSRRIRRILPALLGVVIATLTTAYEGGRALTRRLAVSIPNCSIIPTADIFEDPKGVMIGIGRELTYIYDDHLSEFGANLLLGRLRAAIVKGD